MAAFLVSLILGTLNTFYAALLISKCWGWFAYHVPFLKGFELNFWQALCLILVLFPFHVLYTKIPSMSEIQNEKDNALENTLFKGITKLFVITFAFGLAFIYNIFING